MNLAFLPQHGLDHGTPCGLSLGGRYCLALARREGIPALTAERRWPAIAAVAGVAVELVR